MSTNNEQELTEMQPGINESNEPQPVLITSLAEDNAAVVDMDDNEVRHYCPRANCMEKYEEYMICKALRFYSDPVTRDIRHSFGCFVYNSIYFFITLAFALFDFYTIGFSIMFTILACIGLVLLWFSFECIILFSTFDLKLTYFLVEKKDEINEDRKHLLALSLYTRHIPFCCCNNNSELPWYSIMFSRIKYLYISLDLYIIIAYHIVIKPIMVFLTVWPIFVVLFMGYLVIIPFWFAIDNSLFVENKICIFGNYQSSDGLYHCNGFNFDSMGVAFAAGIIGLFLFPLALKLNNLTAKFSKITQYYFYTYYYTKNEDIINDKKLLLGSNNHKYNHNDDNNETVKIDTNANVNINIDTDDQKNSTNLDQASQFSL